MPRLLALFFLCLLIGCGGTPPSGGADPAAARAVRLVWLGLDDAAARFVDRGDGPEVDPVATCDPTFATWFADFGVRGLACTAAQVVAPTALLAAAPTRPFVSGPHAASAGGVDLDLTSDRAFGHYDPAFVRWAWGAAVPDGAAERSLIQPIYRRHAARLARIYWLTYTDLAADGYPRSTPVGPLADYAAFLDGGPVPAGAESYAGSGFSVFAFTDRSEGLLPQIDMAVGNDWELKYEANTAYGFWLRRRADGTHAQWRDGLRDLLAALDADWLSAHGG
jgi:hypothetical protein